MTSPCKHRKKVFEFMDSCELLVTAVILFFVSDVLEACESQVDKLLDYHLEIYSSLKQDKYTTVRLLQAWRLQLDEHFYSFGTIMVVKLVKTLMRNFPKAVAESEGAYLTFLKALIALIMKLYRRNKELEGTTKNEQILAKELLQEVLDTVPQVSRGTSTKSPLQHIITECNFAEHGSGKDILARSLFDVELMKILLDCRIHINDVNSVGATILHHAVHLLNIEWHPDVAQTAQDVTKCLTFLLQRGANPNARNHSNSSARTELYFVGNFPEVFLANKLKKILKDYEHQHSMTLEYMAAVAVKRSKIAYEELLPTALVKFVNLLGPRPRQCWEEDTDDVSHFNYGRDDYTDSEVDYDYGVDVFSDSDF